MHLRQTDSANRGKAAAVLFKSIQEHPEQNALAKLIAKLYCLDHPSIAFKLMLEEMNSDGAL
jgi:hypothetical protein